ncbi:hypothetical protein Leryth_014693 [Lithospermum erythrorhizon]|nr:hypothetical protein Leryth_014693 [Lithospermum erythrorhizon]
MELTKLSNGALNMEGQSKYKSNGPMIVRLMYAIALSGSGTAYLSSRYLSVLPHKGSSSNHSMLLNNHTVKESGSHANKGLILDSTSITHPYQIDDFGPTWTSPMMEALGATKAFLSTTGALSNMFIRVRCLDTRKTWAKNEYKADNELEQLQVIIQAKQKKIPA